MELTYNGSFGGVLHPEVQTDIHIFGTPMGTFEGHATAQQIFAEEAQWRTESAAAAARAWDSYAGDGSPFKPNPWLGETALPAPGQPHPVK